MDPENTLPSEPERTVRHLNFLREMKRKYGDRKAKETGEDMREREVTPEYERQLTALLLTVHVRSVAVSGLDLAQQHFNYTYRPLLTAIPAYTKLEIVVSGVEPEVVAQWLKDLGLENEVRFHSTQEDLAMWSQDYVEALKVNGESAYLVPKLLEVSADSERQAMTEQLNGYPLTVSKALPQEKVKKARFYFAGGNLCFDRGPEGLRVFIGSDDIRINLENFKLMGTPKTVEEVKKIISEDFGGAEVIVMGDPEQKQHPGLFHIDQAFLILDGKNVVMHRAENPQNDVEEAYVKSLQAYKAQLEAIGYTVHEIPVSCSEVFRKSDDYGSSIFTSVNAIPYVDKNTQEKCVIFPVFQTDLKGGKGTDFTSPVATNRLTGRGLAAYNTFHDLGYKPIPVLDTTGALLGNVHCMSNVIAQTETAAPFSA